MVKASNMEVWVNGNVILREQSMSSRSNNYVIDRGIVCHNCTTVIVLSEWRLMLVSRQMQKYILLKQPIPHALPTNAFPPYKPSCSLSSNTLKLTTHSIKFQLSLIKLSNMQANKYTICDIVQVSVT
jgi:hypothetical protein